MAIPTQAQISAAIVSVINTTVPTGRVWDRIRIAETTEQYADYYVDDNKIGNVWFVRRVGIRDDVSSFDDILAQVHTYELRYARAIVDDADSTKASEALFQKQIEDVRAAINADSHLGLGNGAGHNGMQIVEPIPPSATLGAYTMHMAVARLEVVVIDC